MALLSRQGASIEVKSRVLQRELGGATRAVIRAPRGDEAGGQVAQGGAGGRVIASLTRAAWVKGTVAFVCA